MKWLTIAAALSLAGCSTNLEPTQAELRARWESQNIYPERYKEDLVAFMRTYLNHPENVRSPGVSMPQLRKVGPGDRYIACVRYNPQDGDGGYAGVKESAVVYVSGKLTEIIDTPEKAKDYCKDVKYDPFPALARLTR